MEKKKSSGGWKFFTIFFGLLLAAGLGFYFYKQQNPDYDPWEEPWEKSSSPVELGDDEDEEDDEESDEDGEEENEDEVSDEESSEEDHSEEEQEIVGVVVNSQLAFVGFLCLFIVRL